MERRGATMDRFTEQPKRGGYSATSFFVMLIFTIIVGIAVIALLYLFFRKDGSKINPSECPEALSGILIKPDKRVAAVATNCGNTPNCTYTVASIADAVEICTTLGSTKCAAFSMTQRPSSDDYEMVVSEGTSTIDVVGTDTLRIIV